jgi:uridine kinase
VVLVEGIFLFKAEYRDYFDLTIWIDCSFSTALARAINRAQEGLSPANTIAAYDTIYFPAQKIHLAQDQPREHADLIFENNYHNPRSSAKIRV